MDTPGNVLIATTTTICLRRGVSGAPLLLPAALVLLHGAGRVVHVVAVVAAVHRVVHEHLVVREADVGPGTGRERGRCDQTTHL